jgi:hypothetical protein
MIITSQGLTIPKGSQISNEIDLCGWTLVGIYIPSHFDGGVISLLTRTEDPSSDPIPVHREDGLAWDISVGANRYVALTTKPHLRYLRIGAVIQQDTDTRCTLALADHNVS